MLKIFWFTLKHNYKTIWLSISVAVVTLALASILGEAISNMQETGIAFKEKVAIYNNLSYPNNEYFDEVMFSGDFDAIIQVEKLDNEKNAEKLIEDRKYDTVVIAANIDGHDSIEIISVQKESFMCSIALKFTNIVNTFTLIGDEGIATPEVENQYSNEVLYTVELENGRPIGIDYYGVQTLLQMSTLLALMGIFTVMDDRTKNLFPRIQTLPISKSKIIAARLLANVTYMTSIQVAIAALSKYTLGVNWSGNYLVIITAFAMFSLVTTALAMLAATLTKSTMASIGIMIGLGSTLWPRYSGAFSPYTKIGKMGYTSPNLHTINAIFSAIYGGSSSIIIESLLWLTGMAILLLGAYALVERRRKNDNI